MTPTMLAARFLSPSTSPEFVGERREVFPIQRYDEINISRESSDIDEAKKSSRTDDRNRIFSDEVFAAELEEIDYANAFLLGMDVGAIATDEEVGILSAFLRAQSISEEELLELDREDMRRREVLRFQEQLRAFWERDREESRRVNRRQLARMVRR
jgi:hypothetical protein